MLSPVAIRHRPMDRLKTDGGQRRNPVGVREGLEERSKMMPKTSGTLYEAPVRHDSVRWLAEVWRAAAIQYAAHPRQSTQTRVLSKCNHSGIASICPIQADRQSPEFAENGEGFGGRVSERTR